MDSCPINNKPCPNSKSIDIYVLKNGKQIGAKVCETCAYDAMQKAAQKNLEILTTLIENIHEKYNFEKTCNYCGSSYEDLLRKSRFGCENCYITFMDHVLIMLDKCQVGRKHIGKRIKDYDEVRSIDSLKHEMHEAVKVENYERAAELKKKIESLVTKGCK